MRFKTLQNKSYSQSVSQSVSHLCLAYITEYCGKRSIYTCHISYVGGKVNEGIHIFLFQIVAQYVFIH